ncbi:hypothetical protein SAMN04487981_104478 [Streptomyces sp. cf386]|uniref:hypothetical protein n=1 Tax=Streptomyces sp. cf386 TaxID=1761904 RepID=UPI0008903972|nr:hypothetical protein [Streptomyces sp. cf386]SDN33514.1 hypothetical protein SAMN04487981_104478 [Streptomyces sp. cf386]
MRLSVSILEPIEQFSRLCKEKGRKMFAKRKVACNWRQGEGTPSRRSRLSVRATALVVLGAGVVGLWSAPMAHAECHDSRKGVISSSSIDGRVGGAGVLADDLVAQDGADANGGDVLNVNINVNIGDNNNNNNNNNNGGGTNNNNNNNNAGGTNNNNNNNNAGGANNN